MALRMHFWSDQMRIAPLQLEPKPAVRPSFDRQRIEFSGRLAIPGLKLVRGAGLEPARLAAADFKSATSTGFVIRALAAE